MNMFYTDTDKDFENGYNEHLRKEKEWLESLLPCPFCGGERNAGLEGFDDVKTFSQETHEKRNGTNMFSCHHYCTICDKRHDSCTCKNPVYEIRKQTNMKEVIKNNHPTLKPINLNFRITQLFKLPIDDQKLYVPFAGTFSEIIGAVKAGYNSDNIYGCEMNKDYIDIGQARLEYWQKEFAKKKVEKEKLFE